MMPPPRPGEWRDRLEAERHRAALAGRQWHVQRWVDNAMTGADELENTLALDAILVAANESLRRVLASSAHWWHG